MKRSSKIICIVLGVCFAACVGVVIAYKAKCFTLPFVYKECPSWSIGYYTTNNPAEPPAVDSIHWIDPASLGYHPVPQLMADPFIVKDNDMYYIFYEEFLGRKPSSNAFISVMQSKDLQHWQRLGIVLQEPFHLSFPNVFQYRGEWYMIPEAGNSNALHIYRAVDFPMQWEEASVAFEGNRMIDNLVYCEGDTLFLMGLSGALRLWYTTDLCANSWIEHPMSPIERGAKEFRPGGQICKVDDTLYCFAQSSAEGYGTGVIAFRIDSMTTTYYHETRLENNPILWKHGETVAEKGMHTLNFIQTGDSSYFCVCDGVRRECPVKLRWDWKVMPTFCAKH